MNVEELAKKLNGCEYRDEVSTEVAKEAKECGLAIVFGASDDLMEFRGAIYEELGTYDGGSAFVTENGLVENECEEGEDCPYFKKELEKAQEIIAEWCPRDGEGNTYASWLMKTEIPHKTFDVMEDGELYCRGLVFSLSDVKASFERC